MKKKIIVLLIALGCVLTLVGGSIAYYTTESTAKSTISSSNVKVEMNIVDESGTSVKDGRLDIMAGSQQTRKISVTNTGKEGAWVRVKASVTYKGNNLAIKEDGSVDGNTDITINGINTTEWTYKDGYFYLNEELNSGETTPQLFESVTFKTTMNNEYQQQEIKLAIEVFATQTKHNGTSSLEAKGWPQQ